MDNIFVIKVLSSFFIAGTWIALSTVLAERFGSKIGGLISNLPSNILISLLFIALVNDISYVTNAIVSIPIGIAICTLFLVIFIKLLKYNLYIATSISVIFWFAIAILSSYIKSGNLIINLTIYLAILILSIIYLEKVLRIPTTQNSKKRYSTLQIVFRVVFSGSIVASIVTISKFCNPHFTGIFSTFPAMLLSTMVILSINQGNKFAQSTGKILTLSLSNIVIYVLAVYFTYPIFGIALGTVISYLLSTIWILFLYPLVKRLI